MSCVQEQRLLALSGHPFIFWLDAIAILFVQIFAECDKNKAFMELSCAKSCATCDLRRMAIDARGQQSADLVSLFPGLAAQASELSFDPVSCAVTLPEDCQGTLTCVSIPVLLPTDPFVQGLERARDLGHMAARRIVASV